MKIIIERKDVQEVQRIAAKHMLLKIPAKIVRLIITASTRLQAELLSGGLDTYGREVLTDTLIEFVLVNSKPTVVDDMIGPLDYWHWPCNASSEEYSKAFYKKFFKSAEKLGMTVIKD